MWLKFLSNQRKVYGNKYKESKAKFEELLKKYLLKKLIGQERIKQKKPLEHWLKQIKQKKKQNQKSYVTIVNVMLQKRKSKKCKIIILYIII